MYKLYHHDKKGAHRATAALFGTIVGAGVFALPAVVVKSGVPIALFWMVILGSAAVTLHLIFGEVVLRTPGQHRLIGYCRIYLGRWAGDIQALSSVLGLAGASLAYLILGGIFMHQLLLPFADVSPDILSAVLFGITAITVWKGANFLARVDFWLSLGLGIVLLLIIAKSFTHLEPSYITTVNIAHAFTPYGLILFSFGGLAAITEMNEIIGRRDAEKLRKSIVVGTIAAIVLTALFAISTVGALGPATSSESIAGLAERFGGCIPMLGAAAGFLAIITSYIVFSLFLKEQFQFDFHWPHGLSWAIAVMTPFFLFLMGIRSFGVVLSIIGGVLGGIQGIFVCLTYLKVRKKYGDHVLKPPLVLIYLLMTVFAAGALYEFLFWAL